MSDPKFVDENRDPKSMTGEDDKDVEALARPYPVGTNEELDDVSVQKGDLLGQEHTDPVLNAKMHLVNDAIDEIGFTGYHWKLFVLNGFGYAVDSLILLIQSIIATQAAYEFNPSFTRGMTIAVYVGMLTGALFWGLTADIIGRKFAFNFSLLICSIFAIVAGASPNWYVLGLFVCLSAFGGGGNLVLDTAVFLEYLPSKNQWLVTLMAAWWGLGQLVAGLFAWAFLPNYSCDSVETCTYENNKGWRYVWYANGALVFVMSIARITVIKLRETPKFLIGEGKDEQVIETLQFIANKYNRPCSLTLERLQACGVTGAANGIGLDVHAKSRFSFKEVGVHLKGLFASRKLGLSTSLIWFSWLLIGLAYPLYNVFLPTYLATRGAEFGEQSQSVYWRNYAIANLCSIPSPVLAGYMCRSPWFWGRRGTMIIGALVTMAFFFAYTQNIYYGTLYAYTPEVLPSAHRGTGNGIAIGLNRVMGILSAVIATVADTSTPVPIYICAALYIVMAAVACAFPYEPMGRRSS
ncbi:Filamentous Growth Regulator [Zalaria obscura]|uniref:Filamentous Growth Regulator n=1 Tax=Zalaria obscura TaxID=2024903 RepID=A0ACC3SEB4_9PEZI